MAGAPARIAPGDRRRIGLINTLLARVLGAASGTGPPHLFTTLALHRRLFRPWLRFAGRLMPGGVLPRADSELVILRVAHNTGCAYERRHHERIAGRAGLSRDEIDATSVPPPEGAWSPRRLALLRATDELHTTRDLSDEVWQRLRGELSDAELIELCMLVGHYEMLAMTLNALRVQPDPPGPAAPAAVARVIAGLARRRAA